MDASGTNCRGSGNCLGLGKTFANYDELKLATKLYSEENFVQLVKGNVGNYVYEVNV